MKSKFFLLVLSMSLLKISAFAQTDYLREPDRNKPMLFADLPPVLPVTVSELERLINVAGGSAVTILLGSSSALPGIANPVTTSFDNRTQSVSIKMTGRADASFVLSRVRGDGGKISYTGRVTSFQHGDCLVLRKDDETHYSFVKKNYYELFGE